MENTGTNICKKNMKREIKKLAEWEFLSNSTGCPIKKVSIKILFGAAQGFDSQFLNLFGFSICVSFVWCIILRIWTHLGKVMVVFRRCMFF